MPPCSAEIPCAGLIVNRSKRSLSLAAFQGLSKDRDWLVCSCPAVVLYFRQSKFFVGFLLSLFVCLFSFHSGVLDDSGGKILVRKVAGQSFYKGSYSNGVQSLSLPRWRESFVVSGLSHPEVTAGYRHPR